MDVPLPDRRSHLDFLDGIRALAALYVLAHHCWFECFPDGMNRLPGGITGRVALPLAFGHWAVVVFIILSGFCLNLPVTASPDQSLRGGALSFYWRRTRRILPPYFAALLVSLALIYTVIGTHNGTHWDVSLAPAHSGVDGRGLLGAALLIGDAMGSYQVNHAFWSVQVEWKIYFLFPLLVWAARRAGTPMMAAVTAVVAFAVAGLAHHVNVGFGLKPDGLMIHFVGLFAMGMFAADVAGRPRRLPAWAGRVTIAVSAAVTLALVAHHGVIWSMRAGRILDAGVGLAVAPALVLLAHHPRSVAVRLLSLRPLVWLGGISYSFYLLHAPLVQVAYRYVIQPLHLPMPVRLSGLIVTATALTLAAAVPFFATCERPFMSKRLLLAHPQPNAGTVLA